MDGCGYLAQLADGYSARAVEIGEPLRYRGQAHGIAALLTADVMVRQASTSGSPAPIAASARSASASSCPASAARQAAQNRPEFLFPSPSLPTHATSAVAFPRRADPEGFDIRHGPSTRRTIAQSSRPVPPDRWSSTS